MLNPGILQMFIPLLRCERFGTTSASISMWRIRYKPRHNAFGPGYPSRRRVRNPPSRPIPTTAFPTVGTHPCGAADEIRAGFHRPQRDRPLGGFPSRRAADADADVSSRTASGRAPSTGHRAGRAVRPRESRPASNAAAGRWRRRSSNRSGRDPGWPRAA